MTSAFARNANVSVNNSPTVCTITEIRRATRLPRANGDTVAGDSARLWIARGDKSPASVAGRRGAPPYDATRKGLGSENSALLTQRGRIPQRCCHWQLCCLACIGTTRAKASAFNVRRSYFGPSVDIPMSSPPTPSGLRRDSLRSLLSKFASGLPSRSSRSERRLVEPPGIAPGSDPPISARLSP